MTTIENAETLTAATIFDRHTDLTPPEYLTDDAVHGGKIYYSWAELVRRYGPIENATRGVDE